MAHPFCNCPANLYPTCASNSADRIAETQGGSTALGRLRLRLAELAQKQGNVSSTLATYSITCRTHSSLTFLEQEPTRLPPHRTFCGSPSSRFSLAQTRTRTSSHADGGARRITPSLHPCGRTWTRSGVGTSPASVGSTTISSSTASRSAAAPSACMTRRCRSTSSGTFYRCDGLDPLVIVFCQVALTNFWYISPFLA
jgi:hypothetical protein